MEFTKATDEQKRALAELRKALEARLSRKAAKPSDKKKPTKNPGNKKKTKMFLRDLPYSP